MSQLLITSGILAGAMLLLSLHPTVREVVRQLRLLRRSMRREFHRLENDAIPVVMAEPNAKKVTIEG